MRKSNGRVSDDSVNWQSQLSSNETSRATYFDPPLIDEQTSSSKDQEESRKTNPTIVRLKSDERMTFLE